MTDAAQLPSGTVTLLFTDIQGSTRLWEAEPDEMAVALRRHDDILRDRDRDCRRLRIQDRRRRVLRRVRDRPGRADGRAGGAARARPAEDWPTQPPIRVRMGLHTGACEERDSDYFGPVVNRAARLEAVAHGGQVLLSGATAELLGRCRGAACATSARTG